MPKTWFITGASSGLRFRDDAATACAGSHGRRNRALSRGADATRTDVPRTPGRGSARSGRAGKHKPLNWRSLPAARPDRRRCQQCRLRIVRCGGRADERRDRSTDRHKSHGVHSSDPRSIAVSSQAGGGRIVQVSSEGGQIAYPGFSLYHATKWGIEGFIEAVAQEVAPFGIDFIIAEPGPTGTNFGANLVCADPMAAYDGTPAGAVRRAISDGSFEIRGMRRVP